MAQNTRPRPTDDTKNAVSPGLSPVVIPLTIPSRIGNSPTRASLTRPAKTRGATSTRGTRGRADAAGVRGSAAADGAAAAVETLPAQRLPDETLPAEMLPADVPPMDMPPADELVVSARAASSAVDLPNGEFTASPGAVEVGVEATVAAEVCTTGVVSLAGGVWVAGEDVPCAEALDWVVPGCADAAGVVSD